MTALILKSNTWHLIEKLPEKPYKLNQVIQDVGLRTKYDHEWQEYNKALQLAISNAVRVYNQEVAKQVLSEQSDVWLAEPDKVYPVEVSYEIDYFDPLGERLARLLPCKEEGRLTPEKFYACGNYPVMKDKFDMQRNQFDYYAMMQFAYDYAEAKLAEIERLKEGRNEPT